jgi:hypothetical protein
LGLSWSPNLAEFLPHLRSRVRAEKAFTKEGLAYALARINIRYKMLSKMLPRKWGKDGHGYGEPAPAVEVPRNGDDARKLDQHPLKEQIMAWQRIADAAKAKKT